jgi:hypothetical protein
MSIRSWQSRCGDASTIDEGMAKTGGAEIKSGWFILGRLISV